MYFTSVEDSRGTAVDVSMWTWRRYVDHRSGHQVQAAEVPEQVRLVSVDDDKTVEPGEVLVMLPDGAVEIWGPELFRAQFSAPNGRTENAGGAA